MTLLSIYLIKLELPDKMLKRLDVNFAEAVSKFERILKNFQARKLVYNTIFRGRGLEFDGYRDISADDDASMIDWKASLRANELLARQYTEERDINIYFLVDVSSNMMFGSGNKLKAEYAAEIVAVLSHLISNSRDEPGLMMFSDREKKSLMPSKSKNQFYLFLKALSDAELYGGEFDIRSGILHLAKMIKSSNSVVIIVSDFINISGAEKELMMLSSKFETIAFMIRDPLDDSIPKSSYQMLLQDSESGRQIVVDSNLVSEKYSEIALRKKNETKEYLRKDGIDVFEISTDKPFFLPLASFLKSRSKEARR